MELKGKLVKKLSVETGTSKAGKDWKKQTIVINNGDQYNPETAISFFGDDKVKMLEKFKEGADVTVGVNISCKEFNGKWYSQIDGWKVNEAGSTPNPALNSSDTEELDNLPF